MDLKPVRRAIASLLKNPAHDDGSYAPLLIRFAWHCSGTYDRQKGTGGSNGATMRFEAEASDPENAGLDKARQLLAPICEEFGESMGLSVADIWALAGTVAIEQTGGPRIPFATGRVDFSREEAEAIHGPSLCPFGDGKNNPNGSRLPAADLGPAKDAPPQCPMHVKEKATIDAIRGTFERMGFTDRETVCLIILGHQYGRCHLDVSGFEHPWYAFDPAHWNVYGPGGLGYMSIYPMAVAPNQMQEVRTVKGKRQFQVRLGPGDPFMMLPTDMALWWDPHFRTHVQYYDKNRLEFRKDAAECWKKLIELGCKGLVEEKGGSWEQRGEWRGY